jgi:hypothetical protein
MSYLPGCLMTTACFKFLATRKVLKIDSGNNSLKSSFMRDGEHEHPDRWSDEGLQPRIAG